MPTRDEMVVYAAMCGLCSSIAVGEIIVRLPDSKYRVTIWFDSQSWIVAGPDDADPRTFHSGWHEALKEARARLRAG
jgi:hypothetical protein